MKSKGLLGISTLAALSAISAAGHPHVLFVVVDDLGFDDVGFRSGDIHTPHIDALAAHGVVLEQYYAQDVCSPSRASFLSGRYALHHSVVDWIPPASSYGLPTNLTTMADVFKGAGYVTRAVGKWHLGFYKWDYTPTFRGFDSFVGFYTGGEDYFTHQSSGGYDFRNDTAPQCGENCSQVLWAAEGKYSTTVFAEEAVRLINDYDASQSDEHPLFMYLAFQGVHAPGEAPQSYIDPYNVSIPDPKRRTFAGMLSCVDEGLGNVTHALSEKGMLNETVIVFTADNGGPTTTGDGVGARNWPMRGGKHSVWEGGVRVTGLVSGALLNPAVSGNTYSGLMHAADWLPTLATAAGIELPSEPGLANIDGVSQWDAINSGHQVSPRQYLVVGNSTDLCTPQPSTQYLLRDGDEVGCGFSIINDTGANLFKLIKGYGGGPDTWCNTSSLPSGNSCYNPPVLRMNTGEQCNATPGICFPGDDLDTIPSNTTDGSDCCDACVAMQVRCGGVFFLVGCVVGLVWCS